MIDEVHTKTNRVKTWIEAEEAYEWRKWIEEIPPLSFWSDWNVIIIPPFGGAVVRFLVGVDGLARGEYISVYLDCYNMIGYEDGPYWEVFPVSGDVGRCRINETGMLMNLIDRALNQAVRGEND